MTVEVALKRYLAEVVPTKRSTSQPGDVKRSRILIKHLGKYSLAALNQELIAKFRDLRLASDDRLSPAGKPQPSANNTVRLDLAILGHLYTVATKEWDVGLPSNPVVNIRRAELGPGRNRRMTPDEEARLVAAVDAHSHPMLGWIIRIALETGMRTSEIVTLRRIQVDINRRIVRLLGTKNTTPRTVPLTIAAAKLLQSAVNHPIQPANTDLIFFGEPGRQGHRAPYAFDGVWQEIKSKQGLKDLHFHDLRHKAVSRFVESGLSDQKVSAISGHKSMQMLKRYTHLRPRT